MGKEFQKERETEGSTLLFGITGLLIGGDEREDRYSGPGGTICKETK